MTANPLSDLPDRPRLLEQLAQCLQEAGGRGGLVALIVIKVERLREFGIELGYQQGDQLLIQIVERISGCIRQSDVFARLTTTEFAVILPALRSASQPVMAASKLQRVCGEPFEVDGKELKVGLTLGVSMSPQDADNAERLLQCADMALGHAHANGLPCAQFADCSEDASMPIIAMEHDLESAIKASELESNYQPIVDINTGDVTGLELLSRWSSTTHGPVPPRVFVKMAESCGLVMPLTLWTLNTGLREWAEWQPTLPNTSVTINLSAMVLADPHLPDLVLRALRVWETGIGQLTVDVTESAMMADPQACLAVLNQLHEHGVKIAIDDFGTGYSSLAYLKDLPVSLLKIDDSFVTSMLDNAADRRIVQAVIDLAHNLDLTVIAEGVEDEETLDALTLMGCERAQGHLIALPMPSAELDTWVVESPWEVNTDAPGDLATYLSTAATEVRQSAV